ncbi:MAG TPA: hypothetical protein VGG06_24970 [Thermoanaerobaculia bacterium]
MKRATTLAEIKRSLNPKPLKLEELDEFFVETSDVRDPQLSRRDAIYDRLDVEPNAKVLLAGHAGSGKSTELVKFQAEHADRYVFVRLSMIEDGEAGNASVEALLVLIVEAVLREMGARDVRLSEKTLTSIHGWFDETFQVKQEELEYTGSVGGGIDSASGFWGKLLGVTAYLKADIKTGSGLLSKTITRENKRLPQLAHQCGLLIKEAQLALRQGGQELLLILEDLDKVTVGEADDIFIENPAALANLPAKAIFTAPISLFCNPRAAVLDPHFVVETLPMIKVDDQQGKPYKAGRSVIEHILSQRVDLEAAVERRALVLAIEKTGGVLRHLFLVLQQAAAAASQAIRRGKREKERITEADVRYGLNRLKSDLLRRIGVMGLPKEFEGISTDISTSGSRSWSASRSASPRTT